MALLVSSIPFDNGFKSQARIVVRDLRLVWCVIDDIPIADSSTQQIAAPETPHEHVACLSGVLGTENMKWLEICYQLSMLESRTVPVCPKSFIGGRLS